MKKLAKNKKLYKKFKPVLFILPFAVVGVAMLILTRAATSTYSFEPDSGVPSGSAQAITANNTSGGKVIMFGTATDLTTQPPIIPTDPALLAAWHLGAVGQDLPPPEPPEGAFRLICMPGQLKYDDPIVYPGQPGKAHLHMFFGNTLADAYSTFQSLRTTGEGTCQGGPINRSAYWIPTLQNGAGKVIMPDFAAVYYKGDANTVTLPRGLRYIAGDALGAIPDAQLYGSPNAGVPGGYIYHPFWRCVTASNNERAGTSSVTIPTCQPTDQLFARIEFPFCWDGRLDSPNHRAHVVHPKYNDNGQSLCPSDHPKQIPRYTLQVAWTVAAGDNMSNWFISSDRHNGTNFPNGSTLHGDWFGAWDQPIMDIWTQKCIRELKSCSGATYGDGTYGKQPSPWNWVNPNRLVNIPAAP